MPIQLDVGAWGLFCGHGGRQLVRVGGEPCGPVSARKITRAIPRRLLLDENRVAETFHDGTATIEQVTHVGARWTVARQPVLSPWSSTLIGVLAAVFPEGEAVPEPPLVGCWEWVIDRQADGLPTPHRRTYWDRNLFHIYDVDPDVSQQRQGYWEAGEWASELIDQSDQIRVNTSVRDGIAEGLQGISGAFRCLTYNVVTGYGSEHRGRRHLRLVGMVVPVAPGDENIILQGFSYEAPDWFQDIAFEQDANAARVDDVLRGVMSLAKEPMAVVDAATLDVLMTSASWRREDFGHIGGLGEFAIDDTGELHRFISAAAADSDHPASMKVGLRRTDGSVQTVTLAVTGVKSGRRGRDAVIRLDF